MKYAAHVMAGLLTLLITHTSIAGSVIIREFECFGVSSKETGEVIIVAHIWDLKNDSTGYYTNLEFRTLGKVFYFESETKMSDRQKERDIASGKQLFSDENGRRMTVNPVIEQLNKRLKVYRLTFFERHANNSRVIGEILCMPEA